VHGTDQVVYLTYEASTEIEKQQYKAMNIFLYDCLRSCIQTPDGVIFLNEHRSDRDARALYRKLVDQYSKGEYGNMRAEAIETEIDKLKLDHSWTKSASQFIVHFMEKTTELATYEPDRVTDSSRYKWIRRAVSTHAVL
jgi:hypothetical protein